MSPRITQPKNYVPRSKGVTCSPFTDTQTDTQTGGRTHRVTTEGILSVFQDFPSTYHQGSAQL